MARRDEANRRVREQAQGIDLADLPAEIEEPRKPREWWRLYNGLRALLDGDTDLSTVERMVLVALVDCWNAEERCARPGVATIARRVGCTETTVRRAEKRLEEAGILKVRRFDTWRHKANHYTFRLPAA
jgi:hypothetical protein